jgi:HNH endonuclease/AP2 domain
VACVSLERLRQVLDYDPLTGIFTWKAPTSNRVKIGSVAGSDKHDGYLTITVDGLAEYAHRLAWLFVYGVLPERQLDHRNGNPSDNRISNLRLATPVQNSQNKVKPQRNGTTGLLGVCYFKRTGKWTANITAAGERHYLGYFDTPEQASEAYWAAKRELHPHVEFAGV